jgi:hypothetical protein
MQTFVLVSPFQFAQPPSQFGITMKWNSDDMYTVSSSDTQGGEPQSFVPDKQTLYMKVQVLQPHCFKGMAVCNACTAFRGFFWEGTKSMVDDNMGFDVALKW